MKDSRCTECFGLVSNMNVPMSSYSVRYYCPILTKFGVTRQIFVEFADVKLCASLSQREHGDTDGELSKLRVKGAFLYVCEWAGSDKIKGLNY